MIPRVRFVALGGSWSDRAGFAFGPLIWSIDYVNFYTKRIACHTTTDVGKIKPLGPSYGVSRYGYADKIMCIKTPRTIIEEAAALGKMVNVTITKDAYLAMHQAVPMVVDHNPDPPTPSTKRHYRPWIGWRCWTVQEDKTNGGRIDFHRQASTKNRIDYPVAIAPGGHMMIPLKAIKATILDPENLGLLADPLAGVDKDRDQRKLILKGRW